MNGMSLSKSNLSQNQVFPQDADTTIALNYVCVIRVHVIFLSHHNTLFPLSRKFTLGPLAVQCSAVLVSHVESNGVSQRRRRPLLNGGGEAG